MRLQRRMIISEKGNYLCVPGKEFAMLKRDFNIQ